MVGNDRERIIWVFKCVIHRVKKMDYARTYGKQAKDLVKHQRANEIFYKFDKSSKKKFLFFLL